MENKTSFHKFMDATNPVKIELATVDQLDNLTGSLLDQIKQLNDLSTQIKGLLPIVNKAVNLIATVESGQDLVQKELELFSSDARKLGIKAEDIAQWKRLDSTLGTSLRSVGSLIANVESIGRVAQKA